MRKLDWALRHAEIGWRVFPITPNAKYPPIFEAWQTKASGNPDLIREWWTTYPDANIGGLTIDVRGRRLYVIDIDVRDGKPGIESFARLIGAPGNEPLPPTLTYRTPSGGWHYVFVDRADSTARQGPYSAEYDGIDVKTGNAMIVLPGSHTAAGPRSDEGDYIVEADVAPVDLPEWVERGRVRPARFDETYATVRVGQRDTDLTRFAGKLRREGNDEETIFTELLARNATFPIPKTVGDCRRIARSMMRYRPAPLFGTPLADTDLGNAKLLLAASANGIIWQPENKDWVMWDGRRWGSAIQSGQFTLDVIRLLWQTFRDSESGDDRKELYRRAIGLEFNVRQKNMWEVAKTLPGIAVANSDFDSRPYELNCQNGIVDLRTGVLKEHDPSALHTKIAPVDFDPQADMSEWEGFVLWCCSGNAEQARWLQILFGQALIGVQFETALAFFYGPGKNGKTQLTDAIMRTIGDYAIESTAELLVAKGKDQLHTEAIASLAGSRLVICPEPSRGTHWADGRVKMLTGGDTITGRHLFGREFRFTPSHTIVVHGNHQPEIRDHSDGMRRRMRLVPFENRVTDQQEVKRIGHKLAGPGVLRWLVEGTMAYLNGGETLPPSQVIVRATQDYFDEQDQIRRWMDDCCKLGDDLWEPIRDLYAVYVGWIKAEGIQFTDTSANMVKHLLTVFPRLERKARRRAGSTPMKGLQGIGLIMQNQEVNAP